MIFCVPINISFPLCSGKREQKGSCNAKEATISGGLVFEVPIVILKGCHCKSIPSFSHHHNFPVSELRLCWWQRFSYRFVFSRKMWCRRGHCISFNLSFNSVSVHFSSPGSSLSLSNRKSSSWTLQVQVPYNAEKKNRKTGKIQNGWTKILWRIFKSWKYLQNVETLTDLSSKITLSSKWKSEIRVI